MNRRISLLIAISLVILVPIGALASNHPAQRLDSLNRIEAYVLSIGIDPATAIVQTGLRNYAGPSCPGDGWTCAPANRPVIQLSSRAGINKFTCTPSNDQGPDSCTIVQNSSGGDNIAVCDESSSNANVTQSCTITQTNTTGQNKATVTQSITQTAQRTQAGAQNATISQTNQTGTDTANVTQSLGQQSAVSSGGTQSQESHQTLTLTQDTSGYSGPNNSTVNQSSTQQQDGSGGATLTQNQDTADSGPNLLATIDQKSGSGDQNTNLSQTSQQQQQGNGSVSVTQQQSTASGGHKGSVNQSSHGISKWTSNESEAQHQDSNSAHLTQTQFGPIFCCSTQGDNPADTCSLTQTSTQTASSGKTGMTELLNGHCNTSGSGNVGQTVNENGSQTNNSCTGSSCDITTGCSGGTCNTHFPVANASPSSLAFGSVLVGRSSAPQTVTLSNSGDADLVVSSVAISGANPVDFTTTADTCTGATVPAGSSCTVDVKFSPTASGDRSATLQFTDNDPVTSPQSVALSGTGITDTHAPATTFTTKSGSILVSANGDTVQGVSTDDLSGVVSVAVQYREPSNPAIIEFSTTATLSCTNSSHVNCPWKAGLPIPGSYLVTAQATDASGNVENPGPPAISILVI